MVSTGRKTYLGLYDGISIENLSIQQVFTQQRQKKKALAVYLHYPKSYADLEFKKMVDMNYTAPRFSSDEEDVSFENTSSLSLSGSCSLSRREAVPEDPSSASGQSLPGSSSRSEAVPGDSSSSGQSLLGS